MLRLQCHRHKRYNGEKSPRASCAICISLHDIRLMAITARVSVVGAKPSAKEAKSE